MTTPKPISTATNEDFKQKLFDLCDEYFPKGECKERGQAMVLVAKAIMEHEAQRTRIELEAKIAELRSLNSVGDPVLQEKYFDERLTNYQAQLTALDRKEEK